MDENNNNEIRNNPKAFMFGNPHFGGYCDPRKLKFGIHGDISSEDIENIFEEKAREMQDLKEEIRRTHIDPHFASAKTKKEKLQPLSIRVKPHTKKFLKEDSILTPREILEIYEDYANNTESYLNSLIEEEEELQEQLTEIKEKINHTKQFIGKLNETEEKD